MDRLTKQDAKKFLSFGENNKPFLPTDYIREKVLIDYEAKKRINKNASILESLMNWICYELPYSDEHALAMQKFSRTAEEIWKSGKGKWMHRICTDFSNFCKTTWLSNHPFANSRRKLSKTNQTRQGKKVCWTFFL